MIFKTPSDYQMLKELESLVNKNQPVILYLDVSYQLQSKFKRVWCVVLCSNIEKTKIEILGSHYCLMDDLAKTFTIKRLDGKIMKIKTQRIQDYLLLPNNPKLIWS